MKRFVQCEVHEYMDFYPRVEVRVFSGESVENIMANAQKWAKEMNEIYPGGTTRIIQVMDVEDAGKYCASLIKREKDNPQDDSEEFLAHLGKSFQECYEQEL